MVAVVAAASAVDTFPYVVVAVASAVAAVSVVAAASAVAAALATALRCPEHHASPNS